MQAGRGLWYGVAMRRPDPATVIAAPWRWPRLAKLCALGAATAVLLWLSLAPTDDLPGAELLWDKAQHAVAYGVLMTAGLLLFPGRPLRLALFAASLGVAIELAQAAMPFGRHGDWRDLIANGSGIVAGLALGYLARRLRPVSGESSSRAGGNLQR